MWKKSPFLFMSIFVASLEVVADCGCEDDVLIRVEYVDKMTNETIDTYIFGKWWFDHNNENFNQYANNDYDNARVKEMSLESRVRYRINEMRQSYSVVIQRKTQKFNTKSNGEISIPFLESVSVLNSKNLKYILEADIVRFGCTTKTNWIGSYHGVDGKLISSKLPDKVKENIDDHTGAYMYKLGYELTDEFMNVEFLYDYNGGCP